MGERDRDGEKEIEVGVGEKEKEKICIQETEMVVTVHQMSSLYLR